MHASLRTVRFETSRRGRETLVDVARASASAGFIADTTPHVLAFHEALLVTRGRGTVMLDGVERPVAPGVVVLGVPGRVRAWRVGRDFDACCVLFCEGVGADVLRDPRALSSLACFRAPPEHAVMALAPRERRAFAARFAFMQRELLALADDSPPALAAELHALLLAIDRSHRATFGEPRSARTHRAVARFQDLVERDFRHRHRVADYARELALTPGHLRALCVAHGGLPPGEIIRARLALEARRMMQDVTLTASEVAYGLGFADAAYFARFFRREVGASPSAFRRARRAPAAAL